MPFPRVRITCVDGAKARRPFCCEEVFVTPAFPWTAVDFPLPGGRPRGRLGDEVAASLVAGFGFAGRPRGRFGGWGEEGAGAEVALRDGRLWLGLEGARSLFFAAGLCEGFGGGIAVMS